MPAPLVTWANHGDDFVAAAENGPLSATQFHPEKSGDAGAHLLTQLADQSDLVSRVTASASIGSLPRA